MENFPLANTDGKQQPLGAKKSASTFPSQMTLSDLSLTSIDYTECSGNNGVTIQEPLFDQIVKKALTYVNRRLLVMR